MPSWATRLSSSCVAGRASRAVARNRSRPAAQARTMASRCGGTPVEASQRTRVTTARAMCLAMPAWRRSSSSIRPCGRRGATRAVLDLEASLAIGSIYGSAEAIGHGVEVERLAVLLHEVQDSPPRVVARVLPLLVRPVEKAVRGAGVDLHLMWDSGFGQLGPESLRHFERGRRVGSCHQQQQRRLHLRDVWLAAWRPAVETNRTVQLGLQRR